MLWAIRCPIADRHTRVAGARVIANICTIRLKAGGLLNENHQNFASCDEYKEDVYIEAAEYQLPQARVLRTQSTWHLIKYEQNPCHR